jgi:hypothetical protein
VTADADPREREGAGAAPAATDDELVVVRLLELPLALRHASTEHAAELLREMTLVLHGAHEGSAHPVPARLLALADEITTVYGPYTMAQAQSLEDAHARGVEVVDEVVYRVPRSAGAFAQHIRVMLREADEFCRQGQHLLALATPPDVATFREWQLGEFTRQAAGEEPIPWPRYLETRD